MRNKIALFLCMLVVSVGIVGCGKEGATISGEEVETGTSSEYVEQSVEVETVQSTEANTEVIDSTVPEESVIEVVEGPATVYMTSEISSESLMKIYEALGADPQGNIAVKLSVGEPNSNYLKTDLIGELVQSLDATIVECNTIYGGSRGNTAMHMEVAKDHGYTDIADVDIMDADDSISLPVTGGTYLEENLVGSHFKNYDYFVVLSHFKGHEMGGFGGAIKNISIGIASRDGKFNIHTAGGTIGTWSGGDKFLASMAEAGKSVVDALDGHILYINVMNRLSVDCDCNPSPHEPDMHDIGILASFDPVALDQACVDLVYAAEDGEALIKRIEAKNGTYTLEHAVEIGLGTREYTIENID